MNFRRLLDLRKTSHLSDDTSTSSEDIFSGGGDPVGSSTTEKWFMDGDSASESTGILRNSSLGGFALPTVLIASIVMLTVLLVAVTSTAAIRVALVAQYYNRLAQAAGDAGAAYAKACLVANGGKPLWGNGAVYTVGGPLMPDTNCNGTRLTSPSCPASPATAACHAVLIDNNSNIFTTFTVGQSQLDSDDLAINIASVGSTKLLRSSDLASGNVTAWRQYSQASNLVIQTNPSFLLTTIAGAGGTVSSGGTYIAGSLQTITATPNANYSFSSWSGSTGCSGAVSHTITMDTNKTCTANFTLDPNWIAGIAATAMAGKFVRNVDIGTGQEIQYKTTNTAVGSPQGAIGLDPTYPLNMSLVSPRTNPTVNFAAYPAQSACKEIAGRLPNVQELLAIYADSISTHIYGSFNNSAYWSSTEYNSEYAYHVNFSGGGAWGTTKTVFNYVRCVAS